MITFEQYEQAMKIRNEFMNKNFTDLTSVLLSTPSPAEEEAAEIISQYLKENPVETDILAVVKNGGGKCERYNFRTPNTADAVGKIRKLDLCPSNSIQITMKECKEYETLFQTVYDPDGVAISDNLQLSENDLSYLLYLTGQKIIYHI